MRPDRAAFLRGLDVLTALYHREPGLPTLATIEYIDLHNYFSPIDPAEQIRLAGVVIAEMDADYQPPTIELEIPRGYDVARVRACGWIGGVRVTILMRGEDVCEHRPNARLKRDRWVIPAELMAAIEAANGGGDRG